MGCPLPRDGNWLKRLIIATRNNATGNTSGK